ncbi:MAG TPA: sigma-70 family RNA polymerase sigma factor [Thermomicrobiales bacterium]|nr:sigma-70 family RNA polymerase sigma factor [Thermomicrobiales bacterium]
MTHENQTDTLDVTELSDPELVDLVAAGDARALAVLYDRYSRAVFSFALRMLGDRATAEELVQEVYFRAWQQARKFSEGRGTFITWLLSITHNMAIDEIRRRNRRPQRADSADPVLMLTNVRDETPAVEDQAMMTAIREQVAVAMAALPEAQRSAIELAYFRGLTQREIADLQGEPLGTIKTRMRLAVRKLREHLDEHEVELA